MSGASIRRLDVVLPQPSGGATSTPPQRIAGLIDAGERRRRDGGR